ncbi:MAG: hypothetical protein OHK0052_19810 [Anaerolineales bacterium]
MFRKLFLFTLLFALALSACAPGAATPMAYSAGSGDEGFYGGSAAPMAAPAPMELAAEAENKAAYDSAAQTPGSAAPVERMVIKNATLSLSVPNPAESAETIGKLAESMGGFVVASNVYQETLYDGRKAPRASITIRVPAEKLTDALAQIKSGAGQVLNENVSGQDVTSEYTDLRSRLTNLERAETQLAEIMASAKKTEEVLQVYNELTRVRGEIELIKGQMKYYEQAAALSAISIELIADAATQPITIGGWQPQGVARDAVQALVRTLQDAVDSLIWLTLYWLPSLLVWLLPLLLVLWGVRRWWMRRKARQQAALNE